MLVQMNYKLVPIIFFILQHVDGSARIDPLVDTKVGLIRGLRAANGEYSMFMGIPYATVNSENPFGPSIPHPGFNDTFEAFDDSAICPQIEEFHKTITGNLDCLHLNIYVPNSATSKNRLPVLVWIYGGGFSIGFSGRYLYGPRYLIRHDIILVTINYRLGPYGFMCLDMPEVPGNQGLKDQQLALKWIKNNIESFGGDVNEITIFGESAGSASVDFHLHYSNEKLFDKIILQSGSIIGPWVITEPDRAAPLKLAAYLGFATEDTAEALSFLSSVDTNLIIAATSDLSLSFGACVEQEYENVDRFITENPININVPRAKNTPILIGYNNDEWLANNVNKEPEYFDGLNIFRDNLANYFSFDNEELQEMEQIVRHFYNGDEPLDVNAKRNFINFESDFYFNHPTERTISRYLDSGATNVFYYVFSYVGGRNFVKDRHNITVGGAAHADEIGYLFDISYMTEESTLEDQLIIDRMTTLWTNFVKYGNPTVETSDIIPVIWPPVTENKRHYLDIDTDMKVKQRPFSNRMAFWDLFYKLNYKYVNGYRENLIRQPMCENCS
ncbi:acetylcholinesterase [Manduca sexta]|uniref:acetylcholinesterase n=1 Tax=Manduca sexta TaxID=7130 RepID=UPI00188EB75F|nr:acetylcholinesterase [Manduca sexta]